MKVKASVVGLVLAMASAGWAQGPQDGEQRRVRFLKEQLGLTDEQVEQASAILKEEREAQERLDKERQDKIRAILTDEQKAKYEELLTRTRRGDGPRRGRDGGRGPGGRGGMLDRILEQMAENLRRELELSDEVFDKVKEWIDDLRRKTQERMEAFREGGGNWQEEMRKFQDDMREMTEKIKEHLTPEQKEKFEELQRRFGNGRGFGGPLGGRRRRSVEERVGEAIAALKLDPPEVDIVKPLVRKVVEAQDALAEHDRDSERKVGELRASSLSEEEISARLKEMRLARLEKDRTLKAVQRELNENVTVRQELELIRMDILR
ncbi:MAG: hypothetical protein HY716_15095 [Planctomycetes bacterium]|nr:hypothetical protein [Planctomycetota bacterium]